LNRDIYHKLIEYTSKEVTLEKKLFNDLKIYGDEFEAFIYELSKEMNFDEVAFWKSFMSHGFYNPPETYLNLPKIFYLDLKELLFHFKLEYRDPIERGKDISVDELIGLVNNIS